MSLKAARARLRDRAILGTYREGVQGEGLAGRPGSPQAACRDLMTRCDGGPTRYPCGMKTAALSDPAVLPGKDLIVFDGACVHCAGLCAAGLLRAGCSLAAAVH